MSDWNVKTSTLWLLGFIFVLMLVILVLPDIDLPDTAFHRGTAPVLVHAQANAPPTVVSVALVVGAPSAFENASASLSLGEFRVPSPPNFRSILLRSIRC
jgi:hypothetical protein